VDQPTYPMTGNAAEIQKRVLTGCAQVGGNRNARNDVHVYIGYVVKIDTKRPRIVIWRVNKNCVHAIYGQRLRVNVTGDAAYLCDARRQYRSVGLKNPDKSAAVGAAAHNADALAGCAAES